MANKNDEKIYMTLEEYFEFIKNSELPISQIVKKIKDEKAIEISRYHIEKFMKNKEYCYDKFSRRFIKDTKAEEAVNELDLSDGDSIAKGIMPSHENEDTMNPNIIDSSNSILTQSNTPSKFIPINVANSSTKIENDMFATKNENYNSYNINSTPSEVIEDINAQNSDNFCEIKTKKINKKRLMKCHLIGCKNQEIINTLTTTILKLSEQIEVALNEINEFKSHYSIINSNIEEEKKYSTIAHKTLTDKELVKINLSDTERYEITLKKVLIEKIKDKVVAEYMCGIPSTEIKISKIIETALLDYYLIKK